MSDLTNVFTNIADAIRTKTETQITYKPTEMADAINNIETGGGVFEITTGRVITSFNMPVNIPNSLTNTVNMFNNCSNFNQPVIIPNNVTNTVSMFYNCSNFNQPVIIPNNVTNTASMFYGCSNFNQPITIPNNVTSTFQMFCGSYNFNQPVIIPNNVARMDNMFYVCYNFGSNIYLYTNVQKTATKNMFKVYNNSHAKHIFTNNTNAFNGTVPTQSITGEYVTWTQDGNNFYNTGYNIYIHNVANPYTVLNNASYSFNDSSPLPDSPAIVFGSGVRDLNYAFNSISLNSNNTLILFEEGVENLVSCFYHKSYFNQPLTIPSSAKNCTGIFETCTNLNSDIVFRNGVENVIYALAYCPNFASDIWIPESVTAIGGLLERTPYESGTIHISHNIALGNTDNYIYNCLVNEEIGKPLNPSRILNDY